MAPTPSFNAFLLHHTRIATPQVCPEIRLHLADDFDALWNRYAGWLPQRATAPPYWAVAWVGGQALARYTLDHPGLFDGRAVLDLGAGSGLCAIAAAKAGAVVDAADTDPSSIDAIVANASLNDVPVRPLGTDVIGSASRWDVVLAGDLWYDRALARRVNAWLAEIADAGTEVLIGDCGRAFLPRRGITLLDRYDIPAPESLERSAVARTAVWRFDGARECIPGL